MGYRIINGKPYAVGNFPEYSSKEIRNKDILESKRESFANVLNEKLSKNVDINISNHAVERMKELNLNSKDIEKLSEGMNLAENKGSKNTVIFYRDIAFIASVENRTLITAVDKYRAKENVFTNIDSVVVL